MKQVKLLITLIFTTILSLNSLWGADACSATTDHTFTNVPNNSFSDTGTLSNNADKYYYFQVPGPGTITFSASADVSSYSYTYGLSSCPTTTTAIASGGTIEVVGDTDFNFRIRANAANKIFSITLAYVPAPSFNPPIMGNIPDKLITVGSNFSLNISAFVTTTEGDPILSYALTGTLPTNLSFNTGTGVLSGIPDTNGTFSLSVTATDKDGVSNSDSFTLSTTPVSGPPVMGDIPNQDITNGVAYTLNIANYASAIDSAIVSYTLTGTLPTGLNFNSTTGILSGTPTLDGTYSLSAYATDAEGNSNTDDFNITVLPLGVESDLLIIKTPSTRYADVNETVKYIITIANETSTAMSNVNITDVLKAYHYDLVNSIAGAEVSGLDFNIIILDTGSFNCGTVASTATSFTCIGDVPRRTGTGGVPGLARIVYTITTPSSPVPALLYNEVTINGTTTTADASVIVSSGYGGGIIITPPPEHADVIDEDEWADISTYNAGTSKVLKTKISAHTGVGLAAVHLDGSRNASIYVPSDPELSFLVIPYLSNGMCSTQEILYEAGTNVPVVFNITNGSVIDTKNVKMPAYATKNAHISVSYIDLDQLLADSGVKCVYNSSTTGNLAGLGQCVNSANNYYDAFGLTAYQRCQTMNGRPCEPSNHGESNPADPTYNPLYDNELGCLMCTLNAFPDCSSDDFAIRPNNFDSTITPSQTFTAGTPTPLIFRAEQHDGITPTFSYNENENTSFTVAIDINDTAKTCAQPSISFSPIVDFTNGTVADNYTLNNVGDFNLTIHETVGSEFAFVDTDDTNETLRLIEPFATQIKVIPHHFGIDGNLTNGSNGFTYLSNFEVFDTNASRNISASLDLNVTAQAENNATTSNYTALCYAKDGNLTLTLANAITVTPPASDGSNPLSKLIWYHYAPDSNGSIPITGTTEYTLPYLKNRFDSNVTNGMAEFNYKINFDRNTTKVVNPFMVVVNDLNVTDDDGASGAKAGGNATFLFGRTHASRQRYQGNTGPANIYFESYCFTGCDKTLLNGFSPALIRTDDVRWYINEAHVLTNDGLAGAVSEKATSVKVTATPLTTTNPPPQTTNLTYGGANFPYKTTMKNNASNWLIQNEFDANATTNEFQVEFDNQGLWTGDNNTSTTTNTPTDKAKTNRRIMW